MQAGTFRSSSTGQEVSLNGTYDALILANKTIAVPNVSRAGCSLLSIKGSASGVTAFASNVIYKQAFSGFASFVDPASGR